MWLDADFRLFQTAVAYRTLMLYQGYTLVISYIPINIRLALVHVCFELQLMTMRVLRILHNFLQLRLVLIAIYHNNLSMHCSGTVKAL